MSPVSYAPLWCKSGFSFLEGASSPEELVATAHALGLSSIALTDRDSVAGVVRAHKAIKETKECGVHLICGAQLTIAAPGTALVDSPLTIAAPGDPVTGRGPGWGRDTDDQPSAIKVTGRHARTKRAKPRQVALDLSVASQGRSSAVAAPARSTLVLLAADRAGWTNLTRLITAGRRRCDKGEATVGWSEICQHAAGLIALWGGEGSALADETAPPAALIGDMRDAFGDRLYAMVTRHYQAEDVEQELRLRSRAAAAGLPIVAATEVLYHVRARRQLQDVVTCIRHGVTLATAGRRIRSNDEHALRPIDELSALFADDPAAVARTLEIAAQTTFSLAELRYRYPSERLPNGTTTAVYLRALVDAGAASRYPGGVPEKVRVQLDSELALIEELDYPGYFLTMYEIVSYCDRRGILCQGRGSAANSAVCFCLRITSIDPDRHKLLFERFLSRERAEPPDIDLDIEHERREEVIQHAYTVYGRDHAAMVCNVICYRARSALRDVGMTLGIPETALDRAAKLVSAYGEVSDDAVADAGLTDHHAGVVAHLVRLANELVGFPRHLSIHPGGFLLGHEPVHDIVPIENAAMPGRTVIQWDKDDLEELGLFKVDLLALGALHQLHLAFDLIRVNHDRELTLANIPPDDKPTYEMICKAETIGVFQIESRAQMSMLPRLRPKDFYDLVIEISLVRPGPISGGMVHPYLRRRNKEEDVVYPHECLKPVLERTKGVPLFQEQVMELAMVAADYTPGEADQLRRDMAAWKRNGRIEKHRDRLINRMIAKGIEREFAERVFEQIRGFGEYGFPESHAASFALIAYATSWLRWHYLPEFTCALLNAQPMGFYSAATIVGDARRRGLEVRPIDATCSAWDCTLEPVVPDAGGADQIDDVGQAESDRKRVFALRMGMRWIKGAQRADVERIIEARPFASIEDFVRRTRAPDRLYTQLAEAGALQMLGDPGLAGPDGTAGRDRRDALWQIRGWIVRQTDTLSADTGEEDLPIASRAFGRLSQLDNILWDYRISDHSALGHPLEPLRAELTARGWPTAKELFEQTRKEAEAKEAEAKAKQAAAEQTAAKQPEARALDDKQTENDRTEDERVEGKQVAAKPAKAKREKGRLVDYVGIVICRQQPGTAKNTVFATLEDETGFVNLVFWQDIFARYSNVIRSTSLLGVTGRLQYESGVLHLLAEKVWIPRLSRAVVSVTSRDFH